MAEVSLAHEGLLVEAKLSEELARRLLGDLAYHSEQLEEELAEFWASFWLRSVRGGGPERGSRDRDRFREPEEGLRSWRDLGHYPHRLGEEDRGEDNCLHLRVFGQPALGSSSR